jgi:hypothetical protein
VKHNPHPIIELQVSLLKHKSGLAMIMGELEALKRVEKHPFVVSLHLAYHDR